MRNITPIPPPSEASSLDIDKDLVLPLLLPIISSVSIVATTNAVQELLQRAVLPVNISFCCVLIPSFLQASEPSLENLSLKSTPKSDHKSTTEIELALLESNLRTVQLALEILTGTCATLPDPGPDAPENENEDDNKDEGMRELSFFLISLI